MKKIIISASALILLTLLCFIALKAISLYKDEESETATNDSQPNSVDETSIINESSAEGNITAQQKACLYTFDDLSTIFEENRRVSEEDIGKIKVGMTYSEVLQAIGKAQKIGGSGFIIFDYVCDTGSEYSVIFEYDYESYDPLVVMGVKKRYC